MFWPSPKTIVQYYVTRLRNWSGLEYLFYPLPDPTLPNEQDSQNIKEPHGDQESPLLTFDDESDRAELKRFVTQPGVDQAAVEFILEEMRTALAREEVRNDKIEAKAHSLVAWFAIILTLSIQGSALLRLNKFLACCGVAIVFCLLVAIWFALKATRVTSYLVPIPFHHTLWQDHKNISQKGYRAFELLDIVQGQKKVIWIKATYVDYAQSWVRNGLFLIAILAGTILVWSGDLSATSTGSPTPTPTATSISTPTDTPIPTLTATSSSTLTGTPTPTRTATWTASPTPTPSPTSTSPMLFTGTTSPTP